MKLKFSILSAVAIAATSMFFSCGHDPETHMLEVAYPRPYKVLYADETTDSLILYTTDTYKVKSTSPWISIVGRDSAYIKNIYSMVYVDTIYLSMLPNTTGTTRSGVVGVFSNGNQSGGRYYQLGCFQIVRPVPMVEAGSVINGSIPGVATFEARDSASVLHAKGFVPDSLVFRMRGDWDLEFASGADNSWLTLDATHGGSGANVVHLRLSPNKDMENDRTTTLRLLSGDVENKITVRQLKATKAQYERILKEEEL